MPGSRSEPGMFASLPASLLQPATACHCPFGPSRPTDWRLNPSAIFSSLMPKSDVAHINTSAVPQPFLDPALLQEHQDNDTKTGTS